LPQKERARRHRKETQQHVRDARQRAQVRSAEDSLKAEPHAVRRLASGDGECEPSIRSAGPSVAKLRSAAGPICTILHWRFQLPSAAVAALCADVVRRLTVLGRRHLQADEVIEIGRACRAG